MPIGITTVGSLTEKRYYVTTECFRKPQKQLNAQNATSVNVSSQTNSNLCHTSKMDFFPKICNS